MIQSEKGEKDMNIIIDENYHNVKVLEYGIEYIIKDFKEDDEIKGVKKFVRDEVHKNRLNRSKDRNS